MNELLLISLSLIAGLMLGILFFGGLWWTLQNYSLSENSLTVISSSMIRLALLMLGLYFITAGDWKRALVALSGVIIGRVLVTHFIQAPKAAKDHAP